MTTTGKPRLCMTDEERDAYERALAALSDVQPAFNGMPTASVLTAVLDFWALMLFHVRGNTPTEEHLIQLTDRLTRTAANFFSETGTN